MAVARVNPREMIYLKKALDAIAEVKAMCEKLLANTVIESYRVELL